MIILIPLITSRSDSLESGINGLGISVWRLEVGWILPWSHSMSVHIGIWQPSWTSWLHFGMVTSTCTMGLGRGTRSAPTTTTLLSRPWSHEWVCCKSRHCTAMGWGSTGWWSHGGLLWRWQSKSEEAPQGHGVWWDAGWRRAVLVGGRGRVGLHWSGVLGGACWNISAGTSPTIELADSGLHHTESLESGGERVTLLLFWSFRNLIQNGKERFDPFVCHLEEGRGQTVETC